MTAHRLASFFGTGSSSTCDQLLRGGSRVVGGQGCATRPSFSKPSTGQRMGGMSSMVAVVVIAGEENATVQPLHVDVERRSVAYGYCSVAHEFLLRLR